MLALVLKNINIQNVLAEINITTCLPNGDVRNIDEVLVDISNTFKKFNADNKKDKKVIQDKYTENHGSYISQIYCHERDILENSIKIKQIIMADICQKLAGVRKSNELYKLLTSMRSSNKSITSFQKQ
jgi:hypothetical protein